MNRLVLICLKNFYRLPGAYIRLSRFAKYRERYNEQYMFQRIGDLMRIAVKSGKIDLQVYGQENIPTENGFMMYANHQGLFDVVAIPATYNGPLSVVYKKELKNIPLLSKIYTITKSFAMDREDVRQSLTVIQSVTEEVKKGRNYLIFPEGTRSRNGNVMGEFHGGSFRCAIKAKCAIVPIAFIDSWKVLDQKGCKKVSPQIHYLKPISYEEYKDLKSVEVAALVKSRIQEVIDLYGENIPKIQP